MDYTGQEIEFNESLLNIVTKNCLPETDLV